MRPMPWAWRRTLIWEILCGRVGVRETRRAGWGGEEMLIVTNNLVTLKDRR